MLQVYVSIHAYPTTEIDTVSCIHKQSILLPAMSDEYVFLSLKALAV